MWGLMHTIPDVHPAGHAYACSKIVPDNFVDSLPWHHIYIPIRPETLTLSPNWMSSIYFFREIVPVLIQ